MIALGPIWWVEDNPDGERLTRRTRRRMSAPSPLPWVGPIDLNLPRSPGRGRSHLAAVCGPAHPIALTSSIEDRDMIESYSLGANSYGRKLVDIELILS